MLSQARARERMVQEQIIARHFSDEAVLEAMRSVPRHQFVPRDMIPSAYDDHPLSIGHGQTISQPYIVALMTALLKVDAQARVLEVGTGSGYQTAILAEIVQDVFTVEIVPGLAEQSAELLEELGYTNVHARCSDGHAGWPDEAPFDAIIVTAAPRTIPQRLIDQLDVGGRLVVPVGDFYQDLTVVTRTPDGTERRNVTAVRFVPMTGGVD